MVVEYIGAKQIKGSLIIAQIEGVTNGECVRVAVGEQDIRNGIVVALEGDKCVIEVLEGTAGLSLDNIRTSRLGHPMQVNLGEEMLGRTFDGTGKPIDELGDFFVEKRADINKPAMNPLERVYPRNFIQTGISAIDSLITLVRGQKLPIFSSNGLPHDKLAAQIVTQAAGDNYVIFAGIGLKYDTYHFFKNTFMESGVMDKLVTFLNLANSPVAERLIIPKLALATAEYFAFDKGKDVLVVLTDMTAYCEAMREVSIAKGEIPSRKGYPGYMYTELSNIYERAGILDKKGGSITMLPILTMPGDDITHPIPDLTGFITEGQIVLDRDMFFYPPINIMPSLSRLMKDGVGEAYTTSDHLDVSKEVFRAYARVKQSRALSRIIGKEELSDEDKRYLVFGEVLEDRFLRQGTRENRSVYQSLSIARDALRVIYE